MNKLRKALVVILSSLFLLCASLFAACTTGSGKTQAQKPDDAVTPGQSEPAPEEKPGDPQEEACDINVEVNDETLGAYRLSGERTAKGGFKVGTPVTVTVEPNAGYEATLKVNGEEVPLDDDGSYTFTAQADTTVTVDYNYKYRILTTVLAGEGTITPAAPADGEKYAPGEVVQVEVTPAEGYIVDYVKVNGEEVEPGEDGKYTVEVTGRMYVVAEFVAVHTVTVENNGNGTVTLNDAAYEAPIENVKDGTVYTLQVTPADGEEIKAVYVNGALTSLDAENKATITVKADTLIKVVYVGQYTLTVPDDSNVVVKVDGSDAQASYKEGTVLHITVSAAEGYQLTDVTVKVGETPVEAVGGVYTVTMSANVTVEATAEALSEVETHAVTLLYNNGSLGTATLIGAEAVEGKYAYGSELTLTVTPNEGNKIDKVEVNGKKVALEEGKYTFTVKEDVSIYIVFKALPRYTVTVDDQTGADATITVSEPFDQNENHAYYDGEELTIEATDITTNYLVLVSLNGSEPEAIKESEGKYVWTHTVTADAKITVTVLRSYYVTVENVPVVVGDNGETAVGGKVERQLAEGTEEVKDWYRENEDVTLVITPNDGFRISKITVKGNGDPQVTEYTDYIAHSVELPKETCTVTVEYVAIYEISVNVAGIDGVENASVVLTVVDTATKEHHIKDLETLTESAEKTYTLDVGTSMKAEYTAPVTHRVGLDPHIPGVSFGGMAYMTPGANDVGTYTFSFIYSGGSLSVSYELYTHTVTVDGQLQEAPVTNSESYKLPAQPDPQYGLNGLNKNYEYTFTWVVNGVEYAAEATVENVRKDLVVTSKWSAQLSVEKSVTGTPEGGSVDWGNLQDASTLIEGTEFDVTIVVPQGYRAIVKAYAHTKDALSGSEGKSNFASGVYQAKTEDLTAHFKDTVRAGLKLEVEITYEKIFTVTVTENENVDVVILSHGDYNNDYFTVGNVFEFTVTAHEGYRVTAVKANDTVLDLVDGKYSHTLTGETTITIATVQTATVNYTVTGGENGTVSVTLADGSTVESGTTLDVGTVLKVEITANAGYTINATVAGTDYSKQSKVSVDDLALGAGGVTITVTFEKLPTHTVTVTEDEGASHTLSAAHFGEEGYYEGEEVTLTVTVENGYKLVSVDVAGAEETHDGTTYTFTMGTDNVTVTITVEKLYTVTVAGDSSENAQVAIEDQKEWYEANTTVNFTVTVDEGYAIESVTATGSTVTTVDAGAGKYSVTVANANVEIKVETVKLAEVTLTVTGGDATNVILTNGEAPVESGASLPVGTKLTLKITVPDGYKVTYTVPDKDSQVSYQGTVTESITVADGGITISVEFVKVYTVTVAEGSEEHATVTFEPANEHGYESETKVTVTVAAVGEYVIESVTASAGELVDNKDGTYTLTVTENITITVAVLPKLSVNFPAPNPDEPSTSSAPEQGTWEAMDGANSIKIGENTITINGKPVTKIESNGKTDGTVVYTLTTDEGDYTMAWFGEAEGYILMLTDPTAAVSLSRRAVKSIATGGVSYYVNPKYVSEQGHHDAFKETDSDKLVGIDWTADESHLSVTNENGVHVTLDDEPATYVFAVEAGHYLFVIGASAYDLTLAEDGSTLTVNETTYSKPAPVEKIISVDSARLSGALIVLVVTVQNYTGDNLKVKVKLVCGDAEYNPIGANVYGAELNHQFELHFNQIVDLGTGTYALSLKDGETVYDTIPLGDSTHGEGNNKTFDLQANDGKLNLVVADNTPAPTKGIDNIHNGTLAGDGTIDFFANLNGFTADDLNDINGAKLVVGGEYELSLKNTFSTLDNNPVHFMFTIGDKITTAIGEQDLSLKIGETTYPLQNANGTWQGTYETGSLHFALSNSPNNQAKLTVTEKSAEYTVTINEVGDLADGFNFAHLFRKGTADVDEEMSSGSKVKTGDELTLKVTVRSGYTATVQVTGATLVDNGENSYTINEITGNVTITITYAKQGEVKDIVAKDLTEGDFYGVNYFHLHLEDVNDYEWITKNVARVAVDSRETFTGFGSGKGFEVDSTVSVNIYVEGCQASPQSEYVLHWYNEAGQEVARTTVHFTGEVVEKQLELTKCGEDVAVNTYKDQWTYYDPGDKATVATYKDGTLTFTFAGHTTGNWYDIQLFYVQSGINVGDRYNVSFKITSVNGGTYRIYSDQEGVKSKVETLVANQETTLTYTSLECVKDRAHLCILMGVDGGSRVAADTLTITDLHIEKVEEQEYSIAYKSAKVEALEGKAYLVLNLDSTKYTNEDITSFSIFDGVKTELTVDTTKSTITENGESELYFEITGLTPTDSWYWTHLKINGETYTGAVNGNILFGDIAVEKTKYEAGINRYGLDTSGEGKQLVVIIEEAISFATAGLEVEDDKVYYVLDVNLMKYTEEQLKTAVLFDGQKGQDNYRSFTVIADKVQQVQDGSARLRLYFDITELGVDNLFYPHLMIPGDSGDINIGDVKCAYDGDRYTVSNSTKKFTMSTMYEMPCVTSTELPAQRFETTKVELVSENNKVYLVLTGSSVGYDAASLKEVLDQIFIDLQNNPHPDEAVKDGRDEWAVYKGFPRTVTTDDTSWTIKLEVTLGVGSVTYKDGGATEWKIGAYTMHLNPVVGDTQEVNLSVKDAQNGQTVTVDGKIYTLRNFYGSNLEKEYWGAIGLTIEDPTAVRKKAAIDYNTIKLLEENGTVYLIIGGTNENCTKDDFKFDLEKIGGGIDKQYPDFTFDDSEDGKFTIKIDLTDVIGNASYYMHLVILGTGNGNVATQTNEGYTVDPVGVYSITIENTGWGPWSWELIVGEKEVPQETYTVTFDVDGDTSSIEAQTYVAGETFTAPDPAPKKPDHTFLYWYYKQGEEEVKVEEGFVPSEHATENALTLYAKFEHELYGHQFPMDGGLCELCGEVTGWNKEVEVGVKGEPTSTDNWITSRENGAGKAYDPADSERFGAIVPGQKAIVVGKLSAATVQVNNSWLNMHGILFGLGGIWLRDDAFIDDAVAAYMHWTTQITSTLNDSVTDWAKVVALRADADLVLTYDWTSAEKIVITLVITGNDGADVYKQVYTISASDGYTLAQFYGIGIAPEYGYFKGTIYVIGETIGADACNPAHPSHDYNQNGGATCICGAVNPNHTHEYVNGACKWCERAQSEIADAGFTAVSDKTGEISGFNSRWYEVPVELGTEGGLTVGKKLIVVGSVTSAMAQNSDGVNAELLAGYTMRADNWGWTFDPDNDASADVTAFGTVTKLTHVYNKSHELAEGEDIWATYKGFATSADWRVEIYYKSETEIVMTITVSGTDLTLVSTHTLQIDNAAMIAKYKTIWVGGEDATNLTVKGYKLV